MCNIGDAEGCSAPSDPLGRPVLQRRFSRAGSFPPLSPCRRVLMADRCTVNDDARVSPAALAGGRAKAVAAGMSLPVHGSLARRLSSAGGKRWITNSPTAHPSSCRAAPGKNEAPMAVAPAHTTRFEMCPSLGARGLPARIDGGSVFTR